MPFERSTAVGCELLFKLPLAADTNHGSRNSIGNCSGKRCFDQCLPVSGQALSLRALGEHDPGYNIPQTEAISSLDHEHSRELPDRDTLDGSCRLAVPQKDGTLARSEGNSWIMFSFGHRMISSESSLSSRITIITIARIPPCPVMLRLDQPVKTIV